MSAKTEDIIERLMNREGINYLPADRLISPNAFVVTRSGDVCPLENCE